MLSLESTQVHTCVRTFQIVHFKYIPVILRPSYLSEAAEHHKYKGNAKISEWCDSR